MHFEEEGSIWDGLFYPFLYQNERGYLNYPQYDELSYEKIEESWISSMDLWVDVGGEMSCYWYGGCIWEEDRKY